MRTTTTIIALVLALSAPTVAAAADDTSYTVRPGDSLWLIADRHDVTVAALVSHNGLSVTSTIHPGQTLRIPGDTDRTQPDTSVTVQPGDSLWAIAERAGVSLRALLDANDLSIDTTIHPGHAIVLPGAPAVTTPLDSNSNDNSNDNNEDDDDNEDDDATYVVRAGDSLTAISQRHGISLGALLDANSLSSASVIHPGDRLVIPEATVPAQVAASADLVPTFRRAAAEVGIPADLLMAVAYTESRWNQSARSPSGAIGIGQLMPSTARWVARDMIREPDLDATRTEDNIRMSAHLIDWLLDEADGDVDTALAMYLQGVYGVRANGISDAAIRYAARVAAIRPRFR